MFEIAQKHLRQDHLPLISTGRNLAHGHDLHDAYQGFCCFHGLMRHLSLCLYMRCLRNLLARSLGSSEALLSLILPDSHVRQCAPGSNVCCKMFDWGPSQLLCHDVHAVLAKRPYHRRWQLCCSLGCRSMCWGTRREAMHPH